MGKGGTQKTESTVTQSNLPDYAEPYFTRLMERAEGLSLADYTPYGEQRQASLDPLTQQAYGTIAGLQGQGITGIPEAMDISRQNIAASQGIAAGVSPYQFSEFQYSAPQQFTGAAAQQYMSPYVENVLNRQMAEVQRQFDIEQAGRDASAVQAGAFGGSRRYVQDALAQEAASRQKADIYGTGMQTAYEQAAQQFGADRAARMQAEQAMAGELGRVQGAQSAEEAAAQQRQLQALGFGGEQAAQLAGYGAQEQANQVQLAQLAEAAGKSMQAYQQAGLDISYEDFLRQQGFPESQMQIMSSILRGVPISPTQTVSTYSPYNPLQEALGAGIGALGLYRGLMG